MLSAFNSFDIDFDLVDCILKLLCIKNYVKMVVKLTLKVDSIGVQLRDKLKPFNFFINLQYLEMVIVS